LSCSNIAVATPTLVATACPCSYVQDYDEKNPATHKGLDLRTMTMAQLYTHFGLDAQTIDFVGHALALHRDDAYLDQPALPTALKIKLYHDSLTRYDGLTSPYIYPRYGLGELPQVRLLCMV
jgi:Rab GDP dissociation inhibitor